MENSQNSDWVIGNAKQLTLVVFEALAVHEAALARWKVIGPLSNEGSVGPLGLRRQTPFQHNAP